MTLNNIFSEISSKQSAVESLGESIISGTFCNLIAIAAAALEAGVDIRDITSPWGQAYKLAHHANQAIKCAHVAAGLARNPSLQVAPVIIPLTW